MADDDGGDDKPEKKEEAGGGDKKGGDDEDERFEFLLSYLTKSYRLKQDKWNKMIATEEYKVRTSAL